jgi:hypothetical protein
MLESKDFQRSVSIESPNQPGAALVPLATRIYRCKQVLAAAPVQGEGVRSGIEVHKDGRVKRNQLAP